MKQPREKDSQIIWTNELRRYLDETIARSLAHSLAGLHARVHVSRSSFRKLEWDYVSMHSLARLSSRESVSYCHVNYLIKRFISHEKIINLSKSETAFRTWSNRILLRSCYSPTTIVSVFFSYIICPRIYSHYFLFSPIFFIVISSLYLP